MQNRRRYRNQAVFASEATLKCPINRNDRAKLIHLAEATEAKTRQRGRQNGAVSRPGLQVLRALLFKFLSRDGRCFPSYDALMAATGLCRQSVCNALGCLERAGFLRITRRLVRRELWRVSPLTGEGEWYVGVVQTSNWYNVTSPAGGLSLLAPRETDRTTHPSQRFKQGSFLGIFKPSLTDRL